MDWLELRTQIEAKLDADLTPRQKRLEALDRVLQGTHYDHISYPFDQERTSGKYISLHERRPSINSMLCRVVVEDSVSLLFGDAHFPRVEAANQATANSLQHVFKSLRIQEQMTSAAIQGSIGSVALEFLVFNRKPILRVLNTKYITPRFHHIDEDQLLSVTEKRKVERSELEALGYTGLNRDVTWFWFLKEWNQKQVVFYKPWPCSDRNHQPKPDPERTVDHHMDRCPIIWITNLPGGSRIDGPSTFEAGINAVLQHDVMWSMGTRALKYNSDPIKVVFTDDDIEKVQGGSDRLLRFSRESKFELLELEGTASDANLNWLRELRNVALEAVHGLRAHSDKLTMPNSASAIELLHQPLIWLADKLRLTYGEGALLQVAQMICHASTVINRTDKSEKGLLVAGVNIQNLDPTGLSLNWPTWFPMSATELRESAQAADYNIRNGVISPETATKQFAPVYEVEDISAEQTRIEDHRKKMLAEAPEVADATQPNTQMGTP
jgi:hypothetical protein